MNFIQIHATLAPLLAETKKKKKKKKKSKIMVTTPVWLRTMCI